MISKAAVLFEVGQKLFIKEVEVEPPRSGEVLVKMAAGGICHSDLHVMNGDLHNPLPAILGHEGSGVVAEIGKGVMSVRPGDHVLPLWRMSCGECDYCSAGRPALCPEGTKIRNTGCFLDGTTRFKLDGTEIKHFLGVSTFSEYSVMPEKSVLRIPQDLPLDRAALFGCGVVTGVGVAINAARVEPGSTVAVIGTGGVGLNVVQGSLLAGAGKIIAVDLVDKKLDLAREFGATDTVNAAAGSPVEQVRDLTDGKGGDYAFEVIGLPATMRQAYDSLAKRGMAIIVGITPRSAEVSIPSLSLVYEERTITGSLYGSSRPRIDIPKLIDLYRVGKLKIDELLTRTYPFERINEAYEDLERGEVARSLVTF